VLSKEVSPESRFAGRKTVMLRKVIHVMNLSLFRMVTNQGKKVSFNELLVAGFYVPRVTVNEIHIGKELHILE
jgi:hypothetical protein